MDDEGNADQACNDVSCGLGDLHTGHSKQRDADQQHWDCDEARTDQRQDGRNGGLLNALVQHIHRHGKGHEHHADCRIPQRHAAHLDYLRLFLEDADDGLRRKDAQQRDTADEA